MFDLCFGRRTKPDFIENYLEKLHESDSSLLENLSLGLYKVSLGFLSENRVNGRMMKMRFTLDFPMKRKFFLIMFFFSLHLNLVVLFV